jgi:hypothetical protein
MEIHCDKHEKIKKLGIDYIEDKLTNGDLVHPYLFGWFEKPWLSQIRKDGRFRFENSMNYFV